MNLQEAIGVLKKSEEEARLWNSARNKLTELLEFVAGAELRISTAQDEEAALRNRIGTLSAQRDSLSEVVLQLQSKLSSFDADLKEKARIEQEALVDIRASRLSEEAKLADVTAKLDAVKSQLN